MRRVTCLLIVVLTAAANAQEPADLVLTGGTVITMDRTGTTGEAIACRGGSIVAVGDRDEIEKFVGEKTRRIDVSGATIMPGFIEGHGHFIGVGQSKMILDLSQAKQWSDIVAQVKEAASKASSGEWIIGRGWHQSKWTKPPSPNVEGYPTHHTLSEATPRNPVVLNHASGHMCFANQFAMRLSGIGKNTPNPAGGEILRTANGEATGVFRETAQSLIADEEKPANVRNRELRRAIQLANEECLRHGVTSFHDAGSSLPTVDYFRQLAADGQLGVRLWVMIRDSNSRMRGRLRNYRIIDKRGFLTVRAIKRSLDGALGPHGAWLLEPYSDSPSSTGLRTLSLGSLQQTANLAAANEFQLCVHAIGDRANRAVLDLYEETFARSSGAQSRRWRVEHAQHLHPDDIPRFAKLGVIASMQGIHCTSDAPFVVERLGKKRAEQGAYVWQSLLRSGAVVINGTDAPVEKVDPIASFYASVTRRLPDGSTFFPKERMTRRQALRSYTIDAAYAAFEEDVKGSLEPGKLADLVVVSNNLLECADDDILKTTVDYTVVNGKVVFDRRAPAK